MLKSKIAKMRYKFNLPRPVQEWPEPGHVIEDLDTGKFYIFNGYYKGFGEALGEHSSSFSFISDEERHGKCDKNWIIRLDL